MKLLGFLLVLTMVFASIALARGAPNENAFTQAAVSVDAPVVANVPPMTVGYDVICNITTPAYSRFASVSQYISDISGETGLSTTVAERGFTSGRLTSRTGPQPDLVLLA